MEITQAILDDLTAKAKASERLRVNLDLRDSVTDDSQRTWQGSGTWHTVHALKSGTCILEMKNGKYEPLTEVDILK